MKENYEDEIEINTNSNNLNNINNINNFDLKEKLITININSPPINIKSTSDDDNVLINNEINIANSNNTDYIQPSLPKSFNSMNLYKLNDFDDSINFSPRESRVSIIETFDEKLNTKIKFNIRDISLIPLSILNEKSLSLDCYYGVENAPSPLLSEFMRVDKDIIFSEVLNKKKIFFIKKINPVDILTWQKSELDNSLINMENSYDVEIAKQMFRNLLSYMLDRKSSKKGIQHVTKFIKLVKMGNKMLRDEAYLQIYKQLHKNKKKESIMLGWKIFAVIASSFIPSNKDILNIILNFLFFEIQETDDEQIRMHINYIFVRMFKAKKRERKMVPCTEEIEYIENLKSIQIPIYYFNGKHTIIKIESYTTFKDVKAIIMDKLDFNRQRAIFYSIYEICYKSNGTEERFLDDNEIICDVLSLWKSDIKKHQDNNEKVIFRFYLKILIYFPYDESIIDNIAIEYYQTLYDVISGKFNLSECEILILGALQLVNDFGNDIQKAYMNIKENYQNYIPWKFMYIMSNDQWIEKIMEFYSYFMNYEQNECKKEYINSLMNHSTYKTQLFDAKFDVKKSSDNSDNIPFECILGFKQEGIQIFDMNLDSIVFYEYKQIENWGVSPNFFVITINELNNRPNRKLYFHTGETNVIQTIMIIYGFFIVGKDIREMTEEIDKRDSQFDNNRLNRRVTSKYLREKEDKDDIIHDEHYKKLFIFPNSSLNNEDNNN